MRPEILIMALVVGLANWCFRALPLRARLHELPPNSPLARFLGATGPAAIGTLFVASVLPYAQSADSPRAICLLAGVGAVIGAFAASRSVVVATLSGAVAYGLAFWLLIPGA